MIRLVSPHLTIYKPQFNSILSIFNRISGIFLTFFVFFLLFIGTSFFGFSYIYYVMEFYIVHYISYVAFVFYLVGSISFLYHVLFGLEGFENNFLRPIQYEQVDDYDLSQVSYLFNIKLLFILCYVAVFYRFYF